MITSYIFRISMFAGIIIVLASVLFGYLFFEPFLTEKEEIIDNNYNQHAKMG
jgi:hypothetical protein